MSAAACFVTGRLRSPIGKAVRAASEGSRVWFPWWWPSQGAPLPSQALRMGIMSDQTEGYRTLDRHSRVRDPECSRVLRHRSLEVPDRQCREGSLVRRSRVVSLIRPSHRAALPCQALREASYVTEPSEALLAMPAAAHCSRVPWQWVDGHSCCCAGRQWEYKEGAD